MKFILVLLMFLFSFSSCTMTQGEGEPLELLLLVYMVADNNLSPYAWDDLEEIRQVVSNEGTKILVYIDSQSTGRVKHPLIYRVL